MSANPGRGQIPRGVEVLIKKASVDPVFRKLLLAKRAGAADAIGLKLEPAEVAMINSIPAAHLKATIRSVKVPSSQRAAFLGWDALIMLAVLAVAAGMCFPSLGHTADRPPRVAGPDQPADESAPAKQEDQLDNVQAGRKSAEQPANEPAHEKPAEQPQATEDRQGK